MERAVIFQGQGAQYPGMGKELYERFAKAKEIFEEASETLNFDLKVLCFDDPENKLPTATWAQPAITTVNLAAYAVYKSQYGKPDHVAGHSLGEYSAAAASGAISIPETLKLVHTRGKLMDEVGERNPGAMAACLGLDIEKVKEICEQTGAEIANDNTENQIVIAGLRSKIEEATNLLGKYRAKVKLLPISVASHTSLMEPVRMRLKSILSAIDVKIDEKYIPMVSNVTAKYVISEEDLKKNLSDQVAKTVRWKDSVKHMIDHGADMFHEIGPGEVLTGLVRKIDPSVEAKHFKDLLK